MKDFLSRLVAPVLAAFLAAGMAQGAFYQWSRTAASNGIADASVNWAEGMAPSSVNDSGRAMMARLAEWRDDISGSLTTGGTSTAYTLASNQGVTATPPNGLVLSFTANATNGASATLTVDTGNTYPLQTSAGTALASGSIVSGSVYTVTFNSSNGAWMLRSFYAPPATTPPVGTVMAFAGSAAPTNYAIADGSCVSRTGNAALFAVIATTYGTCDGSTTFALPDMRGRAVYGMDGGASRLTTAGGGVDGTTLGASGGFQNHALSIAEMPSHNHAITDPGHTHAQDGNTVLFGGGSIPLGASSGTPTSSLGSVTASATTGITINNTGGGGAFKMVPPAIVLNYIIRVS